MRWTCALGAAALLFSTTRSFGQEGALGAPQPITAFSQAPATSPPQPTFSQAPAASLPTAAFPQAPAASPPSGIFDFGGGSPSACPRIWGDADFLMWWFKGAPVNIPLVTAATNPADPNSGKIGFPDTRVLVGDQNYDFGMRLGGRFTLGGWFDSAGTIGLEANYLFILPQSISRSVATNGTAGSPSLAVPFFNAATGKEDAFVFAGGAGFPGGASLRIADQLQGGELNFVGNLARTGNFRLDGLLGVRYLRFKEDLDFDLNNSAPAFGHSFSAQDNFDATNNFYGGQFGLRGQYQAGRFFIDATAKVALGAVNQTVDVGGTSTAVNPGAPPGFNFANAPGGTFALPTNFGHHTQSDFGVLPEFDLKFGYNVTRNIQAFVGYNFLYLNNVVRPGAVLDHSSNPSQVPAQTPGPPFPLIGPAAPTFSFSRSDFWAQGVNLGLQFKF